MREGVESVNKSMVALSSEFTKSMAAEQKTIGKTLSDNSTAIQNTVDSIKSGITTANNEFNRHVGEMVQKTKEQVVALDKALSEELTKSLEGLGRQLTALSERFVEDYGPLTVKLKALVDAKHIV